MQSGVRAVGGCAIYLVLRLCHAFVAEKRLVQRYEGWDFDGSALILTLCNFGLALLALGNALFNRELGRISLTRALDPSLALAAFFDVVTNFCLLRLGFEVSFLFQLLVEPARIVGQALQEVVEGRGLIKPRTVLLSSSYLLALSLFVLAKRGPFDYGIYFLLLLCGVSDGLAAHFRSKTTIYSGQTRNLDMMFGSLWGFAFSLPLMIWRRELSRAPAFSALADCAVVAFFFVAAKGTLLLFLDKTAAVRVKTLVDFSRLVRVVFCYLLAHRRLGLSEQLSMLVVLGVMIAEFGLHMLSKQKVQVFDHKKERELQQTNYPAATAVSAQDLRPESGVATQRLTQSSALPRKSFHRE